MQAPANFHKIRSKKLVNSRHSLRDYCRNWPGNMTHNPILKIENQKMNKIEFKAWEPNPMFHEFDNKCLPNTGKKLIKLHRMFWGLLHKIRSPTWIKHQLEKNLTNFDPKSSCSKRWRTLVLGWFSSQKFGRYYSNLLNNLGHLGGKQLINKTHISILKIHGWNNLKCELES